MDSLNMLFDKIINLTHSKFDENSVISFRGLSNVPDTLAYKICEKT